MRVATEPKRRVIGVLVVVERAKICVSGIGGVDGVIRQSVFTLEVSDVRRAVNRATIGQAADTHSVFFPPLDGCDAGQVRRSPGLLEFCERVWRTGPVLA